MKVFISWSGDLSKTVAELLKSWIEDVLQGTEAWVSTSDIKKGEVWFNSIGSELEKSGFGIICLTNENSEAPWILFEAGALSKGLSTNRVCPLLVNVNATDLKPPLSQFNCTLPNQEEMFRLIQSINTNNSAPLPPDKLSRVFEKWWPDFESNFCTIIKNHHPGKVPKKRPIEELLIEILETSRSIRKTQLEDKDSPSADSPAFNNPFTGKGLKSFLPTPKLPLEHDNATEVAKNLDILTRFLGQASLEKQSK